MTELTLTLTDMAHTLHTQRLGSPSVLVIGDVLQGLAQLSAHPAQAQAA